MLSLSFHWYVFRVRSGSEEQVEKFVLNKYSDEDDFDEIYVPRESCKDDVSENIKKGKKVFPGYIFIRMKPSQYFLNKILAVPKLYKFSASSLSENDELKVLSDFDIQKIKDSIVCVDNSKSGSLSLNVGDKIKIIGGSFKGVKAQVVDFSKDGRQIIAVIELLGSTAEINLNFDQVQKEV